MVYGGIRLSRARSVPEESTQHRSAFAISFALAAAIPLCAALVRCVLSPSFFLRPRRLSSAHVHSPALDPSFCRMLGIPLRISLSIAISPVSAKHALPHVRLLLPIPLRYHVRLSHRSTASYAYYDRRD